MYLSLAVGDNIRQEGNYHSKSSDTFQQVYTKLGLPKAWHKLYYHWLTEQERKGLNYSFEKEKKNNWKAPVKWWRSPKGDSKFHSMVERMWEGNNQPESIYLITEGIGPLQNKNYGLPLKGIHLGEFAELKEESRMIFVEKSTGKVLHVCAPTDRILPPETVQGATGREDIELLVEAWDLEMNIGGVRSSHT